MEEELQQQVEELKTQVKNLTDQFKNVKTLDSKPLLVNWPFATLLVKRLEILSKGNSKYGVRSEDGYYVGVGDSAVNIVTAGRVIDNINSVAVDWNPNADDTYDLGSASFRWADLRSVLINGADIGFANGWKFREYPLDKKDVSKKEEWMKKHANKGIQLLDDNEKVIVVFTRDGIYGDFKPLNELK